MVLIHITIQIILIWTEEKKKKARQKIDFNFKHSTVKKSLD